MRGTNVGRWKARPLRVVPDVGQVSKNGSKCPQSMLLVVVSQTPRAGFHIASSVSAEQASDILNHDQSGALCLDHSAELGPQPRPSAVFHPAATAGEGNVLTWEPARDDINPPDLREVDLADITQVRDIRPVMLEDLRRCRFELAEPGRFDLEAEPFQRCGDADVESAVSGE